MGKNRTIQITGGIIASLVSHKILIKYTNRPESINHLQSEIDNYAEKASGFNWNAQDKERIRNESLKDFKLEIKKPHFKDVIFPIEEAERLINETITELVD